MAEIKELQSLTTPKGVYNSFPDKTAREQLGGKLNAPGGVKAGDYLRVQSVGADGTVVLEGAEPPGEDSGQNPPQDGEDGATFTPAVSEDGTLSWTNDKGLSNPAPVNIMGPQGERGLTGETGPQGEKGPKGDTGATGPAGADGEKGEKGDTGAPGADGAKGDKGDKGDAGANGTSVTVKSVSESAADGGSNVVTFSDGKTVTIKNGSKGSTGAAGKDGSDGVPGVPGVDGADGHTPVRGVDYWTPADIAAIDADIARELAKRGQLKPEFANSIEECADTTKLYVLPDGFIYAYMTTTEIGGPAYTNLLPTAKDADRTTILNGKGYLDGTRLSSSGSASTSNATGMNASGFICPVKEGDILRIKGLTPKTGAASYVNSYNSANTMVKSATLSQDGTPPSWIVKNAIKSYVDGVLTIPLESTYFGTGFDAVRFSGVISEGAIVTINQDIVEGGGTVIVEKWVSTGHAFVPADYDGEIAELRAIADTHTREISELKAGSGGSSLDPLSLIKNWDAPIYDANIPVFELTEEKTAKTDVRNSSTPDSLYAMYDALMAQYPHYITKTDLGVCSDGVNHVYRYDFKDPEQRHQNSRNSETKAKAILVSGIHYEWAGMFGLYYAMEEITTNPALRDLKRNVHLIVIPCCSPYTTIYEHKSQHGGQQNANGVEVHRNFEVEFLYPDSGGYLPPGELHHGGVEPLSEVESQYIDNVLKQNPDAAFFITCHNFNLDEYYGVSFLWPSVATAYMCNMSYRLIDKMSQAWMDKYGEELAPGIASYRTDLLESWDTRLGYAQISGSPGTETKQATKYGIQAANVEICERFHVHGTKETPEPILSSFTLSRGTEALLNFILMCFGTYDPKDKKEYAPATV